MVYQAAHSPGDQELEEDDPDGLFPALQLPVDGGDGGRAGDVQQAEDHQRVGVGRAEAHGGQDAGEGSHCLLYTSELDRLCRKGVYTGPIDAYFDYCFGELEYRSVRFETEVLDMENYQGNAVVNYTEYEVPYTRIIEHKHFEFGTQEKTVISLSLIHI